MSWASDHGWNGKPSRAVVVSDGERGWVMYWVGCDLDFEIREGGTRDLEDLGLMGHWGRGEKAPKGISIWEGRYVHRSTDDDVSEADGKFRELTDDEWAFVKIGEAPWNPEEWKL